MRVKLECASDSSSWQSSTQTEPQTNNTGRLSSIVRVKNRTRPVPVASTEDDGLFCFVKRTFSAVQTQRTTKCSSVHTDTKCNPQLSNKYSLLRTDTLNCLRLESRQVKTCSVLWIFGSKIMLILSLCKKPKCSDCSVSDWCLCWLCWFGMTISE